MARLSDVGAEPGQERLSDNYEKTKALVGYVPRSRADADLYRQLGFMCGLEVHQQLFTKQKLFCHCPAGVFQAKGEYDAEVIRHMRPTLSEMGEYDGTALMEKKTRKTIIYRIADETACTYDIDDTPPFKINREALGIALEVSLLLKLNIVGELHVTRKQYLDGSIPTGFQRTGIIGIEGDIPLKNKTVRIMQLSIEEDACREVSDVGHLRIYTTDRLGMPLIETVTYPDLLTPDEAAEAGQFLRMLTRTTGKVRTGIGAAREDVNVSITGGTRVEIKGVAHIKWIPELTHNEAFRQKALLLIRDEVNKRIGKPDDWKMTSREIELSDLAVVPRPVERAVKQGQKLIAVNLPHFKDMLSFFTQPGHDFAGEIGGRLKVIACLERPHLIHSEESTWGEVTGGARIAQMFGAGAQDSQIIFWAPQDDVKTALETIDERCRLAMVGVPNETRKSLPDGCTIFERVLPGPDRMYPDTDSAPIAITDQMVETARKNLPADPRDSVAKLRTWQVPEGSLRYLMTRKLIPAIETIVAETGWPARFVALLFGQTLKGLERRQGPVSDFDPAQVVELCRHVHQSGIDRAMTRDLLEILYGDPDRPLDKLVPASGDGWKDDALLAEIRRLKQRFGSPVSRHPEARNRWIMGQLKKKLAGQFDPARLAALIEKEDSDGRRAKGL